MIRLTVTPCIVHCIDLICLLYQFGFYLFNKLHQCLILSYLSILNMFPFLTLFPLLSSLFIHQFIISIPLLHLLLADSFLPIIQNPHSVCHPFIFSFFPHSFIPMVLVLIFKYTPFTALGLRVLPSLTFNTYKSRLGHGHIHTFAHTAVLVEFNSVYPT